MAGFCRIWIPNFGLTTKPFYKATKGPDTEPIIWEKDSLSLLGAQGALGSRATGPLATQPQAAWGLAALVFSHSYFCCPALPWNFAFYSPTLPSPILFHGNRSLINWLHANRFADLWFFICVSKENRVSPVNTTARETPCKKRTESTTQIWSQWLQI